MKLRNKKTGEVVERTSIVTLRERKTSCSLSLVESEEFSSIRKLNEEWEDYKPVEPLIKDEKIRKAVRAWADLQGSCWITKETDQCCRDSLGYFFNSIKEIFRDLEFGVDYTIEELCGEDDGKEDGEEQRADEY